MPLEHAVAVRHRLGAVAVSVAAQDQSLVRRDII